ncbi:tail fiber domain-containing protein [Citrobacter braakii]|uniref:tail fiber domain-containing protein n=1 Tax=Citrobacter braakii TaxID=57706 RepID=UPI00190899BC|nr:tail fiber domain-containing protein [Citrobacter braakii]MBJ9548716.1 tail fiber domain-containing protein [Citrobacter braakii]WFW18694.1 tail fiber domain-containing protein [Citrobacter braakii]
MSAGTLTLNNNSASVAGTDTTFTTELAAGDFIVVVVGGVPFTLPVLEVNSNTRLTLVSNYTGPRATGAAWSAVPRVALNMVTAALVAQSAEALRGLNYDKQNWQQVFSGTGTITVRLPDGTTFSGPAWNSIIQALAVKADLVSGVVSKMQGGTGLSSPFGAGAGSFCEGNDNRLNTIGGKSGGQITSPFGKVNALPGSFDSLYAGNRNYGLYLEQMNVLGAGYLYPHMSFKMYWPGHYGGAFTWSAWANDMNPEYVLSWTTEVGTTPHMWRFNGTNGNATATGNWVNGGSTVKIKEKVEDIQNPRETMRIIRACTWRLKTKNADGRFGIGVLAEGLYEAYPEAKVTAGDIELRDGTVVKDALSVQAGDSGVLAAVHHATIISLMDENEAQQEEINQLKADMEALKKIVEQLTAR